MGSQALQKPTPAGTRRPAVGNILGGVTCGLLCMTVSSEDRPFQRLRAVVLGPVLPQNDGQSPSSSLSETSLCTGSVTARTLRFFFTPEQDPTHPGSLTTQRDAPWGSCDCFLVLTGPGLHWCSFSLLGHSPGCIPQASGPPSSSRKPQGLQGALQCLWPPHPSSLPLKPAG